MRSAEIQRRHRFPVFQSLQLQWELSLWLGILYGFGSWLECARMVCSGSAAYGQGWDMDAIGPAWSAACHLVRYRKISGVVVGVLIFTALLHLFCLRFWALIQTLQFVFEGIIILTAVTLDCLKYVQKK